MNNNGNQEGVGLEDLSSWLISLGLAIDKPFVRNIMKMLAPVKFKHNDF